MPGKGITTGSLLLAAAGGILAWTGLTSKTGNPRDVLSQLLAGRKPGAPAGKTSSSPPGQASSPAGPAGNPPAGGGNAANQALARVMAGAYGWSAGAQWAALNNIAMAESGWSDTVVNSSSGAAGIAQKITGFGPGYRSGNAPEQIAWFLSYIHSRYGDPVRAWAFHVANGWY